MKFKQFALSSLTALVVLHQLAYAAYDAGVRPSDNRETVFKLSDLRSAYLIRAGIVRYDQRNMSPEGIHQQLQRHFDVVMGMLLVSTPRSIEKALARLQSADDHSWSDTERNKWRRRLLGVRYLQLRRLAAYRDRGQFPLNEGQADQPVPIFVDRHDTACAVGHLMRLSGWNNDVEATRHSNNLVYVPDAIHSAVAEWALTSGLTLEEAALIQPAYGGFYAPFLTSDYEAGELSLIKNGLKYENFHIEAQNFDGTWTSNGFFFHTSLKDSCGTEDFESCFVRSGPLPANNIGFNAGAGLLFGYTFPFIGTEQFDPIGTHWINIGGDSTGPGSGFPRYINGTSPSPILQRISLSFDVSTTDPGSFINQIAEHSYPLKGGFKGATDSSQPRFEFTTKTFVGSTLLGTANLKEDSALPAFTAQSASAGLTSPTNHLSVSTTIWLYNYATIDGYVLGFNVVPEPQALSLMVTAIVLSSLRRRRVHNRS